MLRPTTSSLAVLLLLVACGGDDRRPRRNRDAGPAELVVTDLPIAVRPPGPRLVSGGVQQCADPSAREEAMWDVVTIDDPVLDAYNLVSAGFAIADFTGDGRLDMFLPGVAVSQLWVQGVDGAWVEEGASRLAGLDLAGSIGASAADYDGDGDFDLAVFRSGVPVRILRNDDGVFTDVTEAVGLATGDLKSTNASWGDVDGDGDLDVFIGGYGPELPSFLFLNQDGQGFVDGSQALPPSIHGAWTFMGSWIDIEHDGFPELFMPNDFWRVHPSVLLNNDGAGLSIDDTVNYHTVFDGMGIAFGDFNGDQIPDPVESSYAHATMLISTPRASANMGYFYVDYSDAKGLDFSARDTLREFGWGVDVGDLDNDLDEDIVMGFGYWSNESRDATRYQADELWLQDEEGQFAPGLPFGWDAGSTRAVRFVDLDGDGWLDIVKRMMDEPSRIYLSRCGAGSWLGVRLQAPGLNRHGVGATVRVHLGDRILTRWVMAGSLSMFSGGPPEVHFGLGDTETIDELEVFWPDATVTRFTDVPARQYVTVERDTQ